MKHMKNTHIYIKQVLLVMVFASLGLFSCQDEDEGTPVVTNVRVVEKDSAITGGEFGLLIAIQGNNLNSVRQVFFNGVEAELSPPFVTNTNILVVISDAGPKEVTNKITLVTAGGQRVTRDFNVILPPPVVSQLYNEFVSGGEETYVLGNYFFVISQVLIGDQEAQILEQSPRAIKIKLPDVVGQDRITVIGAGGTTVSTFRLNETVGNMINFDIPATGWGSDVCWGDAERVNPANSDIEPVAGRYTRIKQTSLPATGYQGNWVVSTCWFDFQLAPGPATEKVFRFEANISETWKAGRYQITLGTESGESFMYEWEPWNTDELKGSGIKTKGWVTFYIPVAAFTKYANDKFVVPTKIIADVSKIRDLRVQFSNGRKTDAAIPVHNVALDNFRIVDNK
jgi:hypothetical protein